MYSLSCFIFLSDVQCAFNCCLGKQQCKQTFITSHFYISVFFQRFFSSHKNYSSTGKIGKCIEGLNIYFPSIYSILLSFGTNQSFWVYTNVKQRLKSISDEDRYLTLLSYWNSGYLRIKELVKSQLLLLLENNVYSVCITIGTWSGFYWLVYHRKQWWHVVNFLNQHSL